MSKLLINEMPLQVLPGLAMKIGLNEALFAQQLHYWLTNPKMGKLIDGQRWIKNSTRQWRADNFPFWSEKTIGRIIDSLKRQGVIWVRKDLNDSPYDHTIWFTINYEFLEEKVERYRQSVHIARDDTSKSEMDNLSISSIIPESTTETTEEPETTNTETNQPVSRSLIGEERLVGSPSAETAQEIDQTQGEEQQAQQQPEATAVAPPSSEAPPPAEQARSFALLTDPDVGLSSRKALDYSQAYNFPWLVHQVATWWDDYQVGNVAGAGALSNRIAEMWEPNAPSVAFLRSELYARHYPLPPEQAVEWAAWKRDECLPDNVIGRAERPPWLDDLPVDVCDLLDQLPLSAVQP